MSENQAPYELEITRTFNAPREIVFQAWTDVNQLKQWWGPTGMELEVSKLELRPQGIFHYSMKSPEGHVMWGKFVFHEIVEPEKLVFVNSFSDEEANTIPAPFNADFPMEIKNTLIFTEQDGKTLLTMRGGPINATETQLQFFKSMHESMQQGFGGTFDQLDAFLAKA
ncbi:SRPBCC family protein [Paenibacillus radicis (ex Gao et al. 2016)]|uniref:ATPase n=1 Tax=Paenibacillus radicis (ex Gao et al. 2016) TaxID=1737354 RepID=A0A917HAE8_9BACL|nr:SRPBCC domain-containing protein [Paenibacillus radicis (ex Gao et al. 2016)]GGG72811.1 ATPase [Paenibacillus radicis (ex Gao et al. 2016)]